MTGRRRFTAEDSAVVLALIADGLGYRDVAERTGWSLGVISVCVNGSRHPVRLTAIQRAKLGVGVIEWAERNKVAVGEMRTRMRLSSGWVQPPIDTAILLALAEHVHGELLEQTGGEAPTMRAALYRMMGVYGAAKKLYDFLGKATTTSRKSLVLPRDFWAEADPLTTWHPIWWTPESALRSHLRPLARPSLALRGTGIVIGVVVEAAGFAPGLEGAIEQRLGFRLPVWPTGGMGSLPRIDYIAAQMASWVEQNDADEALLLSITDFDASGMIIAAQVEEQVPETVDGIEIVRVGIDPVLAKAHRVPTADVTGEDTGEDKKTKSTHARSAIWLDACAKYGVKPSTAYQAEALDYATWAGIVADEVEARLEGRSPTVEHDPEFVNADRILAAVRNLVGRFDSLGEVADVLDQLPGADDTGYVDEFDVEDDDEKDDL